MERLSDEKVVLAKRMAMESSFAVGAVCDYDFGFDRMIAFAGLRAADGSVCEGISLHAHLLNHDLAAIKDRVFGRAVNMLCQFCGLTPDIAATVLVRRNTTRASVTELTKPAGGSGSFSFCQSS